MCSYALFFIQLLDAYLEFILLNLREWTEADNICLKIHQRVKKKLKLVSMQKCLYYTIQIYILFVHNNTFFYSPSLSSSSSSGLTLISSGSAILPMRISLIFAWISCSSLVAISLFALVRKVMSASFHWNFSSPIL